VLGRFVRRVDTCEVLQLTSTGLGVQTLHIALLGHAQRGVHEHLAGLAGVQQIADHSMFGSERRDEEDQDDEAGVGH
jgi:hypothetical protein